MLARLAVTPRLVLVGAGRVDVVTLVACLLLFTLLEEVDGVLDVVVAAAPFTR